VSGELTIAMTLSTPTHRSAPLRSILVKVPEITVYFWFIKVLSTTVGETFADWLTNNVGLGEQGTLALMAGLLLLALVVQFRLNRYVAPIYWLCVVLISVAGTLVTDTMVDKWGISLITSTVVFALALAATFVLWYRAERTLSIHTVDNFRREAFYWTTILFTFALGTAAGDLFAERIALGYFSSLLIFAAIIAVVGAAYRLRILGGVAAFWTTYVVTRPLGASLGDFLSQPKNTSGIGLGTTTTSLIFLSAILGLVTFLAVTHLDSPKSSATKELQPVD
jgi:uncharacterized membrane-anchored protein